MGEQILKGHCLCRKIKYELAGEKFFNAACACEDCQRASGTHVNQHLGGKVSKFKLLAGKEFLKGFGVKARSGHQATREFCSECGSQLFFRSSGHPDYISLCVSSLEKSFDQEPHFILYSENIPSWYSLPDKALEKGKALE